MLKNKFLIKKWHGLKESIKESQAVATFIESTMHLFQRLLSPMGTFVIFLIAATWTLLQKWMGKSERGRKMARYVEKSLLRGLQEKSHREQTRIIIERIFRIEDEDWPYILVMFPLFLLVSFGVMTGNISTQSLFVSRFGKEYIPWMFFFDSLGLFIISIVLTSFVDRLNKEKLFRLTLFILGIIIFIFWGFMVFEVKSGIKLPFIYPLFFIAEYIFKIILFGQFWLLANEICDTRQSKRIFGLISSGGIIGATISSFSIRIFVTYLNVDTQMLYIIWTVSFFIAGLITILIKKFGIGRGKSSQKKQKIFTSLEEQFQDIEVGYKEVKGSQLLQTLGILIILCFALSYTLDYQFLVTLSEKFSDENNLTAYLANVKGVASLFSLFVQLLLTNRIIAYFGQHNSMRSLPVSYFIGFFLMGTFFNYIVSSIFVFFRDVIFLAVYNPSYQMMYNAIAEQNRGRAKSFLEGISNPLALLAAFLILRGLTLIMDDRLLGFVAALIAIGFLYISNRLKKDYEEALIAYLKRDDYKSRQTAKTTIRKMEGVDLQKIIYKALVDGDKDTAIFATEMLQKSGTEKAVNTLFFALRRTEDREIRLKIIETIGKLGTPETGKMIYPYLRKARDKSVQIASLKALANLADDATSNRILSLLRVRDYDIRATTAAVLWLLGEKRGQSTIEDMVRNPFPEVRRAAVKALSEVSNEKMGKVLANFLKDDDPEIRKYVLQGLANIQFEMTSFKLTKQSFKELSETSFKLTEHSFKKLSDPNFKLTEHSFGKLEREELPPDVLKNLDALKDIMVINEENFIDKIKEAIGEEHTESYKSLILKHALRKGQIPSDILENLDTLKDQVFTIRKYFTEGIEKAIGEEHTENYKSLILKHAVKEKKFPLDILKNLGILKNQLFVDKKDFIAKIKEAIGEEHTATYEALILEHAFKEGILDQVTDTLSDSDEDVRTTALVNLPRFGVKTIKPLIKKFKKDRQKPTLKRRVVQVLGRIPSDIAEKHLMDILLSSGTLMQDQVLRSLNKRENIENKRVLEKFVFNQLYQIYRHLYHIHILTRYENTDAGEVLIAFLRDEIRHKKDLLLHALGLIEGDIDTFYFIQKKLRSDDKFLRANALETLESLSARKVFKMLLPLFESPLDEKILNGIEQTVKMAKDATISDSYQTLSQLLLHPYSPVIRASVAYLLKEIHFDKFKSLVNHRSYKEVDPLVKENLVSTLDRLILPKHFLDANTKVGKSKMLTILEKIFFLKKVPMFSNMNSEELRLIANICSEKRVNALEMIMNEKEAQEEIFVYIVIEGLVQLTNKTPSGEEKILKFMTVRDYFGDIEVFDDQGISSVTVMAMDNTRLMTIRQKEFRNVLLEYPSIAVEICKVFSTKLRNTNRLLVLQY
ncbi:MAG: hypothetical protein B6244_09710 [Candidatus Cloacimonetes bacterium 4572_55]|nr:MAG: hypothetical protein B6244_09710 [Candidatus Cloacimonetes bacterium 4572_55]